MKFFRSKPKTKRAQTRRDPTYGGLLHVTARGRAATQVDGAPLVLATTALVGLLCLLLLLWALWLTTSFLGRVLFTENPRFQVREITARSDGVLRESLLIEWAGVTTEANLFQISLKNVRERLEKNAIVRNAVVRRRLPNRIEIEVNERVAIARMGQVEGQMNWLVDVEGVLIRKSLQDKHLPFLLGVPQNVTQGDTVANGRGQDALRYLAVLREMPVLKRELFEVQAISVGHPDYLDVRLASGIQVLLPRVGNSRAVLEEATRLLEENRRLNLRQNFFDLTMERGNNRIGARR